MNCEASGVCISRTYLFTLIYGPRASVHVLAANTFVRLLIRGLFRFRTVHWVDSNQAQYYFWRNYKKAK